MKKLYIAVVLLGLAAACSTPAPVTGHPDRNVSTSGTIGSVKATDGPPPEKIPVPPRVRDSVERKRDTVHLN